MINKIKNKILKNGIKQTIHLIIEKIRSFILVNINYIFLFRKKNNIQKDQLKYWKNYKYVERTYKKYLNKVPKYEGTNEYSNIVWWCWLQGEENAPRLQKSCLNSLRKNLKDRKIIVITEENLYDYVDFPEYIKIKYKKKIISHTHFSDLIRLQLLVKYGGTWIDSSVYCSKESKDFFDIPLFVYKHYKRGNEAIVADNWFISAEKNNPILRTTRDLLFLYWKKNNYLLEYFLMHYIFTLVTKKYEKEFEDVPTFSNLPPHILQYESLNQFSEERFRQIKEMSNFHKLTQKLVIKENNKDCFYQHILDESKELVINE